MSLDQYDGRGAVPPDVQRILDHTKKAVKKPRHLIRETDATLRSHADWHEHIAQDIDDCK
jgi:hypothetical protein